MMGKSAEPLRMFKHVDAEGHQLGERRARTARAAAIALAPSGANADVLIFDPQASRLHQYRVKRGETGRISAREQSRHRALAIIAAQTRNATG